jgi:hypothetical protein
MSSLYLIIPVGVVLSLIFFLAFEARAIRANKDTAIATGEMPMYDIDDKFKQYDTINNTGWFTVSAFVTTLVLAILSHDPSYGLIHALVYIFLTTFIGSAILMFIVKRGKNLVVKVFASFLYGTGHILGASFAFLVSFLIN